MMRAPLKKELDKVQAIIDSVVTNRKFTQEEVKTFLSEVETFIEASREAMAEDEERKRRTE
jgi:polyhydroxyalkanoate synthesis regulator phasin